MILRVLAFTFAASAILLGYLVPSDLPFRNADWSHLAANLTIVVTGANTGLGYSTVEHLARIGTSKAVVLACRSIEKCEKARDRAQSHAPRNSTTKFIVLSLDLAHRTSIENFCRSLTKRLKQQQQEEENESTSNEENYNNNLVEPTIDVVINNAGIFANNVEEVFVNNVEEHMLVNHLGHVLMLHLLWPTLTRSNARIVSVSSMSAVSRVDTNTGWFPDELPSTQSATKFAASLSSYVRSKRANVLFAQELHERFGDTNSSMTGRISSVGSHPGYTRTEIFSNGPKVFPFVVGKFLTSNSIIGMSSSEGAWTQLWAALDRVNLPSGHYVGPHWWLFGAPIELGRLGEIFFATHLGKYTKGDGAKLWDKTMKTLDIRVFGES